MKIIFSIQVSTVESGAVSKTVAQLWRPDTNGGIMSSRLAWLASSPRMISKPEIRSPLRDCSPLLAVRTYSPNSLNDFAECEWLLLPFYLDMKFPFFRIVRRESRRYHGRRQRRRCLYWYDQGGAASHDAIGWGAPQGVARVFRGDEEVGWIAPSLVTLNVVVLYCCWRCNWLFILNKFKILTTIYLVFSLLLRYTYLVPFETYVFVIYHLL